MGQSKNKGWREADKGDVGSESRGKLSQIFIIDVVWAAGK